MDKIYFISEKKLRAESLINDNVDSTFINSAIMTALTIGLQEIVGTQIYNDLKQLIKDNNFKDENNKILIEDYIQPYLINKVMSDICIPIHYKFKNSGITTNTDMHFQTASLNEINYVADFYKNQAVFYSNRILDFINTNKESFDVECGCGSEGIAKSNNTTRIGIYFRK